jgi:hypothetical protein
MSLMPRISDRPDAVAVAFSSTHHNGQLADSKANVGNQSKQLISNNLEAHVVR